MDIVRATHSVKIYAWYTASASFIKWAFVSSGDPRPKIEAKIKETGKTFDEVVNEVSYDYIGL